jgi:hypothetical protein
MGCAYTIVGDGEAVERTLFKLPGHRLPALTLPNVEGAEFTPIGASLPLTVEIAHAYTGKYPSTIFGSSPMLITSAIKNLSDVGAGAEAVNFLVPKVSKKSNFPSPPADTEGTRLICYVPAVTATSTTVTLNLVFEIFPDAAFEEIGSVFSGIGQLPIFLTQSPYLIGASSILKVVQDIGDAIFNGKPKYSPTFTINFSDVGTKSQAGYEFFLNCKDDSTVDPGTFSFEPNRGLIDPRTKLPYAGDAPYFVIAIDGAEHDDLKGFAPLAATAGILSTFFNIKDGGVIPVSDIVGVFSAANDVEFGEKALAIKQKIAAAPPGSDTSALQAQLKAYLADIQSDSLQKLFANG